MIRLALAKSRYNNLANHLRLRTVSTPFSSCRIRPKPNRWELHTGRPTTHEGWGLLTATSGVNCRLPARWDQLIATGEGPPDEQDDGHLLLPCSSTRRGGDALARGRWRRR